jgi:hypothetical protein
MTDETYYRAVSAACAQHECSPGWLSISTRLSTLQAYVRLTAKQRQELHLFCDEVIVPFPIASLTLNDAMQLRSQEHAHLRIVHSLAFR